MLRSLSISLSVFLFVVIGYFGAAPAAQADTIVDIAVGNEDFSSLVDAVVAQDLVDTLSNPGPFTVFAPTNEAFAALPGFVTNVLNEKPELLTQILLYHVVADDLSSAEVLARRSIKTAQGEFVRVNQTSSGAFINSSELTAFDIDASNGTIHVIDRVLLPNAVYGAAIDTVRKQIEMLRLQINDIQRARITERGIRH
jgi:uncharacterized surface protein with fasciclin (FAS1) repeats